MFSSERELLVFRLSQLLDAPPSEDLVQKLIADPALLTRIEAARSNPIWIYDLIGGEMSAPKPAASAKLVGTAFSAQVEYAKSRFAKPVAEEFSRRWHACQSCHHLVNNPGGPLYFLGKAIFRAGDDRVCNLCGCPAYTKAGRLVERCPSPSESDPSINRWGQPLSENSTAR